MLQPIYPALLVRLIFHMSFYHAAAPNLSDEVVEAVLNSTRMKAYPVAYFGVFSMVVVLD